MTLRDEHCTPSRRDTPRLSDAEAQALLGELEPGWERVGDRLVRTWRFPDFASGLAFVSRLGPVADAEDHHPDVFLAWGRVRLELWTHAAGGLTRNDYVLAARIEPLAR